ncbi:MAG: PadR family transcriptional regulator [Leuconostoc gelidum]|jgi:PadR family transcriptional regulator PadR|uniref:PadR family transcriptional regulator n=1 Tax=Leuconostoc gelidum subsp. gelidum TaxID=1607839 RepID=A0AB35FY03_LEUGE|nr:PadR family transcriptional regulator [Leuconostoc gelidum]AFS40965.1 PadR family transcriptional regulator [Leuconostoc gelidum JB7]MBZ5964190.1 PadR family transcriptional regulator [Leuconostoc gelidum subsp. gelidum]MBZ5975769.1 PadR family transcriptional regulator [Leuconostoc gelidum subsp. gelidum]MBZ5976752.1 PadR family transcriptional regulator [Leuconostoc gelidum subsp. gelidum]MBZ5979036.1 PadR family transcriptional regulator [Leuconostoc gelidum subsp. gelidum]
MMIQTPTVLLDGTVLAILDRQDLYGYALTKKVKQHVIVSESTMYPVLRRLEKGGELTTYSEPFEGRMRKYYQLTDNGREHLRGIKDAWQDFSTGINAILGEQI